MYILFYACEEVDNKDGTKDFSINDIGDANILTTMNNANILVENKKNSDLNMVF
jgi:hypothetical protein